VRLSTIARRAVPANDWPAVKSCAREILRRDKKNAEGWFLSGLYEKSAGHQNPARSAFSKALRFDSRRYDAAVELADLEAQALRHRQALELLEAYKARLDQSPLYLDRAARIYSRLGLHAKAWPLYSRACELQPDADSLKSNLAANAVLVGKIEQARTLYQELLRRHPGHQRNHYELSRLQRATDRTHLDQMLGLLRASEFPPARNIFLYYAIAKELEDLEQWEESFDYYRQAGDAAAHAAYAAGYQVRSDVQLIDRIIDVCNQDWLSVGQGDEAALPGSKTPIFIVGLPRTGTTLTERIIASHSRVESADESFFMQIAINQACGRGAEEVTTEVIRKAAATDMRRVASRYLEAIDYRLADRPMFIDKYPFNFLYLGFIARAFPDAKIVHLRRNPMDACFAMYKQSFFKFAYTLDDLGEYYLAYDRLHRHWQHVLGERVIEVQYEALVSDFEPETRKLLERLGLEFEPACLEFHKNETPSATASAAQIREKAHTRSVGKWKKLSEPLQPLRERLEKAGIPIG